MDEPVKEAPFAVVLAMHVMLWIVLAVPTVVIAAYVAGRNSLRRKALMKSTPGVVKGHLGAH